MFFLDRADAGRRLADRLGHLRGADSVVLGLPRGGVPVAARVAAALKAPLDVLVVRKLGLPVHAEVAMGAIGEEGVSVVNEALVRDLGVTAAELAAVERAERAELDRRTHRYRGDAPPLDVAGRVAVVVDDGIATGATAAAGCRIARMRGAGRVVLAVPVAPAGWERELRGTADEFVASTTPVDFMAVGAYYRDFSATSDAEVVACLEDAARVAHRSGPPGGPGADGEDG